MPERTQAEIETYVVKDSQCGLPNLFSKYRDWQENLII